MTDLKMTTTGDYLVDALIESHKRKQAEINALKAQLKERNEIIEAVAHIGVDFGYGSYELEEKHIDKARELLAEKEKDYE